MKRLKRSDLGRQKERERERLRLLSVDKEMERGGGEIIEAKRH